MKLLFLLEGKTKGKKKNTQNQNLLRFKSPKDSKYIDEVEIPIIKKYDVAALEYTKQ